MSDPRAIAEASLRANIHSLPSGQFLTAGRNQFLTLWTRDFCHAVRGLIAIGEEKVAFNHLTFLLNNLRPSDGLVPRVMDNRLVQWRVAYQSARRMLPFLPAMALKEPLKPQYTDEHGSCAVDSNHLLLLAALRLRECTGGKEWWKKNEALLKRVWDWYGDKWRDGLIWQTPFADWQDCAKREGHAFLTNFFIFITGERLRALGWEINFDRVTFRTKIHQTFFDPNSGVYKSLVGSPVVSIDGNLLALEASEFLDPSEKRLLWEALKVHPLLTKYEMIIGSCGIPEWPRDEIAVHARWAHLERYHGEICWSWLMGLGLRVAKLMEDQRQISHQEGKIRTFLERDGEVVELYDPRTGWLPWESWLIKAERPFAWGSAYLVEALS